MNNGTHYIKLYVSYYIILIIACNQAGLGVAAIFGPLFSPLARHINSMCNTLEVPHIEYRMEPQFIDSTHVFSINLYPDTARLSKAYLDVIKFFRWTKFVVIYGDENGEWNCLKLKAFL